MIQLVADDCHVRSADCAQNPKICRISCGKQHRPFALAPFRERILEFVVDRTAAHDQTGRARTGAVRATDPRVATADVNPGTYYAASAGPASETTLVP